MRDVKLDLNPLCEECERKGITVPAELIHHIVPISSGGDPFPDLEGLEALCTSCHSKHHNAKPMTEKQKKFLDLFDSL